MWEKKWDGHRVQGRSRAPPRLMATAYSLAKSDGKASLRCRTCGNPATVRRREARRGKNSATRRHARGKGETLLRWRPCRCAPRMRKRAARAKKRYTRQNRAGACTGQCRGGVGTNTKTVRTRNSTSGPGRPRPVGRFACLLTRCFVSPRATVPHRTIPPCAPCVIS